MSGGLKQEMLSIPRHVSVMKEEVLSFLEPIAGGIFIDACVGDAGYTEALLEHSARKVYAVDCDHEALGRARFFLENKKKLEGGHYVLIHGFFSRMPAFLPEDLKADGVIFDLGFSSYQMGNDARGLSLRCLGALDMRFSLHAEGPTAAHAVNTLSEASLAWVFRAYGQEKGAYALARAIVHRREKKLFHHCSDLADIAVRVLKKRGKKPSRIHPATKMFQALRLLVNDELMHIAQALLQMHCYLKKGGRMIVIAFHSLEDKIVKNFIRLCSKQERPFLKMLTKKPLRPTDDEVRDNARARSACLRVASVLSSSCDVSLEDLPLPALPQWKDIQIFIRNVRRAHLCV